jgi:hypothetical protein
MFASSLPAGAKSRKGGWGVDYPRSEWYLAYGFPNVPANVLPSQSSTLGPISLGYRHFINEKLGWGLSLSYARTKTKNDYILVQPIITRSGNVQSTAGFLTSMADLHYKWHSWNDNYLYSGVGVGYCLSGGGTTADFGIPQSYLVKYNPPSTVAYQINIIGINYLIGKWVAVFIQGGYGYTGIVSGGLSLRHY